MRRGAVENLDDRKILDGFIGCYSFYQEVHENSHRQ